MRLEQPQFWYQHFLQRCAGTLPRASSELWSNSYFLTRGHLSDFYCSDLEWLEPGWRGRKTREWSRVWAAVLPLWAPPAAGRQGAHPTAFVDANHPEVQEAATNEPKQKSMREVEKTRRWKKGEKKQAGKQPQVGKRLILIENLLRAGVAWCCWWITRVLLPAVS